MKTLNLEDGKYKVLVEDSGRVRALRYDQPWRELSGDKFIYCLVDRILDLEAQREKTNLVLAARAAFVDWLAAELIRARAYFPDNDSKQEGYIDALETIRDNFNWSTP